MLVYQYIWVPIIFKLTKPCLQGEGGGGGRNEEGDLIRVQKSWVQMLIGITTPIVILTDNSLYITGKCRGGWGGGGGGREGPV